MLIAEDQILILYLQAKNSVHREEIKKADVHGLPIQVRLCKKAQRVFLYHYINLYVNKFYFILSKF